MPSHPLGAFANLQPKPRRFSATVSIEGVFRQAKALTARADAECAIVMAALGIDLDRVKVPLLPEEGVEARPELVDLALRTELLQNVERGTLALFVFLPIAGRFFALPRTVLTAPPWFVKRIADQEVTRPLRYPPKSLWETGVLAETECAPAFRDIAVGEFPIFTTTASSRAALMAIKSSIAGLRQGGTAAAATSPEVVASVRSLSANNGGRLPINDGAKQLMALHPELRRDDARAAIQQVLGRQRPGPVGPRRP